MAKGVKMLAALMDDDGEGNGDGLMEAAKHLCTAFTDLLVATEPENKRPRQSMLTAASQVGSASHRVLYTIGEEEVADKERQDILLGLAKAVANTTAALVLKAKNVASKCGDQSTQNRVRYTYLVIFSDYCCLMKLLRRLKAKISLILVIANLGHRSRHPVCLMH